MKRAQLNFAVDAAIAVAFLLAALTGILFLLPPGVIRALGLGMPGMFGVSFRAWHWLHDWSGVVAAAGVVLHFALHYRWVALMTRRTFGAGRVERRPAPDARRGDDPGAPVPPAARAPAASAAVTAPSRAYAVYTADASPGAHEPRHTRRTLVTGALAGGAALVVGGTLLERMTSLGAASGTTTSTAGGQTIADAGGGWQSQSGSTGSSGSADSGSTGSATGTPTVTVDSSSCIACGRCLNVCPASVFSWDANGRAAATNAAACIRCHRCTQACPASAITVSA
jgi:NAD-dependent dihydropyrimidine dehydrogenase PreA subunit